MKLPTEGVPRDQLMTQMRDAISRDADWRGGKTWSLVYFAGEDVEAVLKDAYELAFFSNGLGPAAFKSLKKFESEVVAMTADLLGDAERLRQHDLRRHREHPHGRQDRPRLGAGREGRSPNPRW